MYASVAAQSGVVDSPSQDLFSLPRNSSQQSPPSVPTAELFTVLGGMRRVLGRLARPQRATRRLGGGAAGAPRPALEDLHGRFHDYLRVSLTEKCNLRCTYCMPADGVELTPQERLMTTDEVLRTVELFVAEGVTKLRLTGGEPLVRRDLVDIVRGAKALGVRSVGVTTNGVALTQRRIEALAAAGLDSANISLDTLDPHLFQVVTRRRGHEQVLRAIDAAAEALPSVKVNVVVMRGVNDAEVPDFVAFTERRDVEVRFIEYMPFDGNRWAQKKLVPYAEMLDAVAARFGAGALERLPGRPSDVAKTYAVRGFRGRVGFITSMSEHFCAGCSRLRVTADGNLKVCLFDSGEVSLRDAMRGGASREELVEIVAAAVARKKPRHAGMIEISKRKNRPMITIGG